MSTLKSMSKWLSLIALFTMVYLFNFTKVEARETFGVVDIINRVNITNLNDEQLLTFHAVSDSLIEELYSIVDVIDLTDDTNRARLDEIAVQLSQGDCSEFQDSDCDYIVYGYLMNFNLSHGERIVGKSDAATANVSIRVVDTQTGKCVFVATGKGVAKARAYRVGKMLRFGQFEFSEEELISALESAAHDIAEKMKKSI